jgi:hypothetical protein
MDAVEETVAAPLRAFFKDSYRLVKRCNKPDRKGASCRPTRRATDRRSRGSWFASSLLPLCSVPFALTP